MDIIFNCPFCDQELAADPVDSGTEIECPSCSKTIKIPIRLMVVSLLMDHV